LRTVSSKYGIPEDEILKTIQESEEFKNMTVDPVLDTDQVNTLGYLQPESKQVPIEEPPASIEVPAVKKKTIASKAKKSKETPLPAPMPVPVPVPTPVVEEERREPEPEPIKPKTIKKKVIQKPIPAAVVEPVLAPAEGEPRKIIKKKVKITA